jgi:hypothetical protein
LRARSDAFLLYCRLVAFSPEDALKSNWGVTGNSRHAVEVAVVTGQIGQAVRLHDGNNQPVVGQQAGRLTDAGATIEQGGRDSENLDAKNWDFPDSLSKDPKFLDFGGILPQPRGNARGRPAEVLHGFEGHEPVSHLRHNMRGSLTFDFLPFDPHQEVGTRVAVHGVRSEMINKRIGVQEDGRPPGILEKITGTPGR